MFNLFKKKEEVHPISHIFSNLTENQKMSVHNFLFAIICPDSGSITQKEELLLNEFVGALHISIDRCFGYVKASGLERTINDLDVLSRNQREFLVVSIHELILRGGSLNDRKIMRVVDYFEKIGIDTDEYMHIVKKSAAIMRHFSGR